MQQRKQTILYLTTSAKKDSTITCTQCLTFSNFRFSNEESRLKRGLQFYQSLPEGVEISNFQGPFLVGKCFFSVKLNMLLSVT